MPRYRALHTKIVDSYDFNEMPDDFTRLTWVMLTLVVDSEGRGIDNPAWLRAKMYPMREDVQSEQIKGAMAWYAQRGMIVRYSVNGKDYFYIPTFRAYQPGIEKEAKSSIPAPEQVRPNSEPTPEKVGSKSASYADAYAYTNADADADAEREAERAFPDADAGEWKAGPPPPPAPADPENFEGMSVRQAETIKEIQLVVKATGWMPGKPVWRMVVETIRGYKLSEATVRECYTAWCARGFKRENIAWLTEWAVNGIPQARGNEKRSGNTTSPDAILAALDQAARMAQ